MLFSIKLQLNGTLAFFTTEIYNLGPPYVKPIFVNNGSSMTLNKLNVILCTCAASRGIILSLVPD